MSFIIKYNPKILFFYFLYKYCKTYFLNKKSTINKGNNKITELLAILQRESQNS